MEKSRPPCAELLWEPEEGLARSWDCQSSAKKHLAWVRQRDLHNAPIAGRCLRNLRMSARVPDLQSERVAAVQLHRCPKIAAMIWRPAAKTETGLGAGRRSLVWMGVVAAERSF